MLSTRRQTSPRHCPPACQAMPLTSTMSSINRQLMEPVRAPCYVVCTIRTRWHLLATARRHATLTSDIFVFTSMRRVARPFDSIRNIAVSLSFMSKKNIYANRPLLVGHISVISLRLVQTTIVFTSPWLWSASVWNRKIAWRKARSNATKILIGYAIITSPTLIGTCVIIKWIEAAVSNARLDTAIDPHCEGVSTVQHRISRSSNTRVSQVILLDEVSGLDYSHAQSLLI